MIITPNYIGKNSKNYEKSFEPFSKLFSERIIFLFNEINDDLSASVISQMLVLENANPNEDINLYINSPGGSVTAGFAIYDVMRRIKCDVSTVACGMCASMGAFLLASGTKGKRYALENSQIMLHQVLGGASGQASDVEIAVKNLIKTKNHINGLLSDFCGRPIDEIAKLCDRDLWLDAKQAQELGIVDKVM